MSKQFEWFVFPKYGVDGTRVPFHIEQEVMNTREKNGWEVHKIWDDAIYFRRKTNFRRETKYPARDVISSFTIRPYGPEGQADPDLWGFRV